MTKQHKLTIRTFGMLLLFLPFMLLCAISVDYVLVSILQTDESVLGLASGRFDTSSHALALGTITFLGALLIMWIMHDLYWMKGIVGFLFQDIRQETMEKSGMIENPDSKKQPITIEQATRTVLFFSFAFHSSNFSFFWFLSFDTAMSELNRLWLIEILFSTTMWYLFSAAVFFSGRFILKFGPNYIVTTLTYSFVYIFLTMWLWNVCRFLFVGLAPDALPQSFT